MKSATPSEKKTNELAFLDETIDIGATKGQDKDMIITLDLSDLDALVEQSSDIFLDPKAEDVLLKLLDLQERIDTAITEAAKRVEQAALQINPNFSSIMSDRVKVSYRAYGSKYYVMEEDLEHTPQDLYATEMGVIAPNGVPFDELERRLKDALGWEIKVTKGKDGDKKDISRSVDSKAVEKFAKQTGKFPVGIREVERAKSLKFTKREATSYETYAL